jgi:hypothetical protein
MSTPLRFELLADFPSRCRRRCIPARSSRSRLDDMTAIFPENLVRRR